MKSKAINRRVRNDRHLQQCLLTEGTRFEYVSMVNQEEQP
jgi:hypothetical protein